MESRSEIIKIDPTNPTKSQQKILYHLLMQFKQNPQVEELSKKKLHDIQVGDKAYQVELPYSISKSTDSSLEDRTKQKSGVGAFGAVKKSRYKLNPIEKENQQLVDIMPSMLVYKRMKFIDCKHGYLPDELSSFIREKHKNSLSKEMKISIKHDLDEIKKMLKTNKPWDSSVEIKIQELKNKYQLDESDMKSIDDNLNKKLEKFIADAQHEVDMLNKRYPGLNIQLIKKNTDNPDKFSVHFFMPHIPGKTISDCFSWISANGIDVRLNFLRKLFSDLKFIHENNIVHMDVKPTNVMLTGRQQVRLVDFGLSNNLGELLRGYAGTRGYIAPEAAREKNCAKYSDKMDMHSAGLTILEIMSCQNIKLESDFDFTTWLGIMILVDINPYQISFFNTNKVATIIFDLYNNLTNRSPEARSGAKEVEMFFALASTSVGLNYISSFIPDDQNNFKTILDVDFSDKEIEKYTLQDLHYLSQYSDPASHENYHTVTTMLFGKENGLEFSKAVLGKHEFLQQCYKNKLNKQFATLIDKLDRKRHKDDPETQAIRDLVAYLKKAMTSEMKIPELIAKVESVLMYAIDAHCNKKMKSVTIRSILDELDPFLLDHVSPPILDQAYKQESYRFRMKLNHFLHARNHASSSVEVREGKQEVVELSSSQDNRNISSLKF